MSAISTIEFILVFCLWHLMITFNNKAAKTHYLDILVSLVNIHILKLKKPNPKQTKHKKATQKEDTDFYEQLIH